MFVFGYMFTAVNMSKKHALQTSDFASHIEHTCTVYSVMVTEDYYCVSAVYISVKLCFNLESTIYSNVNFACLQLSFQPVLPCVKLVSFKCTWSTSIEKHSVILFAALPSPSSPGILPPNSPGILSPSAG